MSRRQKASFRGRLEDFFHSVLPAGKLCVHQIRQAGLDHIKDRADIFRPVFLIHSAFFLCADRKKKRCAGEQFPQEGKGFLPADGIRFFFKKVGPPFHQIAGKGAESRGGSL